MSVYIPLTTDIEVIPVTTLRTFGDTIMLHNKPSWLHLFIVLDTRYSSKQDLAVHCHVTHIVS